MEIKDIKKVSCVGAGVIGYSYALLMALKGLDVYLYDISDDALLLAKDRIDESLKPLIEKGVVKDDISELKKRIHYTKDMRLAVTDTYFIQESGPEHYDIKWKIMEEIERYAPSDAIIASSTSGLLISEIAKNSKYPERFVGGHPYNPPHLIPLVEITKGDKTSDDVVFKAKEFYTLIGKEPVVLQKEALGFICNRLQMALYREVCHLVMSGVCSVSDADKAVTFGPGIRWGIMGPSMIFELGGGEHGVEGLMLHLNDSINLWLNDMADFKEFPKEWASIAEDGVKIAIKERPKKIGNTNETLAKYRDDMLIEYLKLHNKL